MNNIIALTQRILQQFRHDPRTIALFMIAPIVALWLFSAILGTPNYKPTLVAIALPETVVKALQQQDAVVDNYTASDTDTCLLMLKNGTIDAILEVYKDTLLVKVEGADASRTTAIMGVVQNALNTVLNAEKEYLKKQMNETHGTIMKAKMMGMQIPEMPNAISEVSMDYLQGSKDWTIFDFFGPIFIGIFIFVFVFITSGISLVTERTGGTMERLLVSPIKSWQIVGGYSLGFGVISLIQAGVVLLASIYLIGFPCVGNFSLVILITFSMALVSLTLGLLVSALAKTAFQVIQLMIVLVVPQVLLSGIFDLSQSPTWLQVVSDCFPISYGASALRDVMLRGNGFSTIFPNLAVLWAFIIVFAVLASVSFEIRRRS
ncbi:MAG: ABC transporter permease [Bacteroidales bacterium]|jgi:ABC-2 type transport system permease protein|nr:ABC transporter permease [Bacteroidales bacterium]